MLTAMQLVNSANILIWTGIEASPQALSSPVSPASAGSSPTKMSATFTLESRTNKSDLELTAPVPWTLSDPRSKGNTDFIRRGSDSMLEPSEVVLQATYEGGKGLRIMGKGLQYGMDVPCNTAYDCCENEREDGSFVTWGLR